MLRAGVLGRSFTRAGEPEFLSSGSRQKQANATGAGGKQALFGALEQLRYRNRLQNAILGPVLVKIGYKMQEMDQISYLKALFRLLFRKTRPF